MAIFFTSANDDCIYANGIAVTSLPFRVTVVFRTESLPAANGCLFFMGDKDLTDQYAEMKLTTTGTIEADKEGQQPHSQQQLIQLILDKITLLLS